MSSKNPLNGRGTSTIIASGLAFPFVEVLFHTHPLVGSAVALLSGAIVYRHYDDAGVGIEKLKSGMLSSHVSSSVNKNSEVETSEGDNSKQTSSTSKTILDIRDIPIPIGSDRMGKRFETTLRKLKSILILGLQEGGKSNTAIHLIRHFVKHGAHLAIIDKHARSEEDSMTSKIKPLENRFDCPVGYNPDTALRVVNHVRSILDERLEGGRCDYPLFIVIDEFTAIMGQSTGGKWQAVAQALDCLISDINQEGRKHQVFALCVGQIANASRTGGTEIRDLFATTIVHAMNAKQANILSLTEINKQVERLGKGEVFIKTEGYNAFWLKIPYVEDAAIRRLAASLPPIEKKPTREDLDLEIFNGLSQELPWKYVEAPGSTSIQNTNFQAQTRVLPPEVLPSFQGSVTTSILRTIAKRVRSGDSLASIRKEYGLPSDGRACQEVNEALKYIGENFAE